MNETQPLSSGRRFGAPLLAFGAGVVLGLVHWALGFQLFAEAAVIGPLFAMLFTYPLLILGSAIVSVFGRGSRIGTRAMYALMLVLGAEITMVSILIQGLSHINHL